MSKKLLFGGNKKAKVSLIDGEVLLEFPTITVKDASDLIDEKASASAKQRVLNQFVLKVLNRSFEDKSTMSDVENMPMKNYEAIVSKLFELNGWELDKTEPLKK